jgi:outer membrane protein assembly factor BamB
MKKPLSLLIIIFACGVIIHAQSRGGNWPTYGGDAQHSGWEGADARISKDTVKDLQLLWKMKLDSQTKSLRSLLPPIILGRLISYRGFKELAFVGTNADIVYAIDADLGKLFWQKHLEYSVSEPQTTNSSWACPGGLTAIPTMPVPSPAPAGAAPRGNGGFGGAGAVYAISSDGRLHRLNTSTGDDITQPISVLPANARIAGLNMIDNVIYAVTSQSCNGTQDAVWAIDLNGDSPKVASVDLDGGVWGLGGPVAGSDGTIYVQTGAGTGTILALAPRDLKLKHSFTLSGRGTTATRPAKDLDMNVPSPAVFRYKNSDLIVTATREGRLALLDSSLDAVLYQTPPVSPVDNAVDHGVWGGISSWEDAGGTRWVLAPVWGPNGSAQNGSIVAFRIEEQGGKPVLTQAWASRDLSSPMPPLITSGVVFALSAGEFSRTEQRPKSASHAILYALDAVTGKELYSSRNLVTSPAALTGLTVANGRVYFGTIDGTFYTFGMYLEH